jgi:hypothetical protein
VFHLAVGVVSGCAQATTVIAASPTPAPPTIEPSPSQAPEAPANPLLVTADGVGYLTIGEPVPTDAAEPIVTWDAKGCDWNNGGGLWTPADGYGKRDDYQISWQIYTVGKNDPVTELFVKDPSMTTATGIHPGSTEDELLAAYPEFSRDTLSGVSHTYVLAGTHGQLIFEVPVDVDTWGTDPAVVGTVLWMRVGELGGYSGPTGYSDQSPCDIQ